MAPRGRPRKGTSRIDAAIDAMAQYGFTKEVVVARMNELLKEYGGIDGYFFIELDAYKVLLDSLLADQEKGKGGEQNQLEVAEGETSNMNEIVEGEKAEYDQALPVSIAAASSAGFIDIPVCTSSPLYASPPPPPMIAPPPPTPPPVINALPPPTPVLDALPPLPERAQAPRRKPCYGWIDDEDDSEPHFIQLTSSLNKPIPPPPSRPQPPPPQLSQPEQSENLTVGTKNQEKRRSRWDMRPEDM